MTLKNHISSFTIYKYFMICCSPDEDLCDAGNFILKVNPGKWTVSLDKKDEYYLTYFLINESYMAYFDKTKLIKRQDRITAPFGVLCFSDLEKYIEQFQKIDIRSINSKIQESQNKLFSMDFGVFISTLAHGSFEWYVQEVEGRVIAIEIIIDPF